MLVVQKLGPLKFAPIVFYVVQILYPVKVLYTTQI